MKIFYVFLLCCFALTLSADVLPFRSGTVLTAELSAAKPRINGEDPLAFQLNFDRRIYAAVVVKLDQGRGISIHDYALQAFGVNYPCIALKAGDGEFSFSSWELSSTSPNTKYSLLFVLDATKVGLAPVEDLKLTALFPPPERAASVIPFKLLGNKNFTAPRSVPDKGTFQVKKAED